MQISGVCPDAVRRLLAFYQPNLQVDDFKVAAYFQASLKTFIEISLSISFIYKSVLVCPVLTEDDRKGAQPHHVSFYRIPASQ